MPRDMLEEFPELGEAYWSLLPDRTIWPSRFAGLPEGAAVITDAEGEFHAACETEAQARELVGALNELSDLMDSSSTLRFEGHD